MIAKIIKKPYKNYVFFVVVVAILLFFLNNFIKFILNGPEWT